MTHSTANDDNIISDNRGTQIYNPLVTPAADDIPLWVIKNARRRAASVSFLGQIFFWAAAGLHLMVNL